MKIMIGDTEIELPQSKLLKVFKAGTIAIGILIAIALFIGMMLGLLFLIGPLGLGAVVMFIFVTAMVYQEIT